MALRNRPRPTLVDTNHALFDSITDLQRLDGLGPRQRPKEPPPPPPPPSPPTTKEEGRQRPLTPPPRPYTDREVQCIVLKKGETIPGREENGWNGTTEGLVNGYGNKGDLQDFGRSVGMVTSTPRSYVEREVQFAMLKNEDNIPGIYLFISVTHGHQLRI